MGLIYNDTVEPFCTDMNNTPTLRSSATKPLKQVSIPTIPGLSARWHTNTINDIAKAAGMNKVAYCDRRIFTIFHSVWEEDSLIVYGE